MDVSKAGNTTEKSPVLSAVINRIGYGDGFIWQRPVWDSLILSQDLGRKSMAVSASGFEVRLSTSIYAESVFRRHTQVVQNERVDVRRRLNRLLRVARAVT